MSIKNLGINQLQRELDVLKFKIDDLCENELAQLSVASPGRNSAYKRAHSLDNELSVIDRKLNTLSVTDEKMSTKVLNDKKKIEKERITELKRRLHEITAHLEPDEVEEDYFRELGKSLNNYRSSTMAPEINEQEYELQSQNTKSTIKNNAHDDGDDNDEDDDEDSELDYENTEDDDGDSFDQILPQQKNRKPTIVHTVEALSDFAAEQPEDLSFKTGDVIYISQINDDGWWKGHNVQGQEGLVPSTLVKIVEPNTKRSSDRDGKSAKNRSGKDLWASFKSNNGNKTNVTDVLQAMKAVPSGFRQPTLGVWYQKGDEYKASNWIVPKTGLTNLQFKDLFWDGINKKLKSFPVKLCRTFSLQSVRCIPPAGAGVQVLTRNVFVALWDQEKIISNIHYIRGILVDKDMSWTFTPKIGKNIPSLYDGDFFVRVDQDARKICVLFELNYSYIRTSTGEKSDMCCGWGSLPLFDENGATVGNKLFEVQIHGGTPFQKGIPLDALQVIHPNQSLMQSLVRTNRQPRLIVKATGYNKLTKELYDTLPSTLVTCQKYARLISMFRHHAALLLTREDALPPDVMCDVIMSYFPRVLNLPDLMDALYQIWEERHRIVLNRSERRNIASLYTLFKNCFMESVFSIMQCANLPQLIWADEKSEKARISFIADVMQRRQPVGGLLSSDYQFRPLNINKLKYVISSHCMQASPITREMIVETS